MDFMISLFGSEQTGRPKKRKSGGQRRSSIVSPMEEFLSGISATENFFLNENRSDEENVVVPVVHHEELPPEDEEGNVEYKV